MKKILTVIVGTYIVLLVSGCGGGSSGASSISESRYYVIVRGMPAGKCEGSTFRNHARDLGAINVFTEEHNDTITCESYGGSRQCAETVDTTDNDGNTITPTDLTDAINKENQRASLCRCGINIYSL